MATTFYLVNTTGGPTGHTSETLLSTSRGGGSVNASGSTTASGNHITISSGGGPGWWFQVAAVTISGTISFQFFGTEDVMATNARAAFRVARYDSGGSFVSDVVANSNANHPDDVEFGTSPAAMTWSATPTSTSFIDGDWLLVEPHGDAIGTMAAGTYTMSVTAGSKSARNVNAILQHGPGIYTIC